MWRWASKYRRKAIHVCLAVCLLPNTSSSLNNSASSGRRIERVLSYGKEKEGSVLYYLVVTLKQDTHRTTGNPKTSSMLDSGARSRYIILSQAQHNLKTPSWFLVLRLWCIDHGTLSELLPARSSVFKILQLSRRILNFQHLVDLWLTCTSITVT